MNRQKHLVYTRFGLALVVFAAMIVILASSNGNFGTLAQNRPDGTIATIYDNGSLATGANTFSGVAAPSGTQWAEVSNDYGNLALANSTSGVSCSVTATVFRCADDFNVPVGQTWTVNQVAVFAYQTGFAGATSPILSATLQIWKGRPGDAGSVIVFGDTSTNRLATSTNANLYRIFNTVSPAPGTASGTTRIIWQNNLAVSPAAVLTAGNYWIDWNTTVAASAAHFAPTTTLVGTRGAPGWNARQNTGTAWTDIVDLGNPAGAAQIPQDFPFKILGSVSGAPAVPRNRSNDFDGDNKSDFMIVRSADASSQSTWISRNSGGTTTGTAWGLGAGFAAGDQVTPADFDGDGKTDIAVWRPGAALTAKFYILNSATNTVSIIPFGQTGDDVSVVGDYDGDGKADPACYRSGATGTFYYRGSLNNVGGNITFTPWGTTGDVAISGDYDGDGKADFSVMRVNGGSIDHWRKLSGGGTSITTFGVSGDKFVPGDYDGDGKADIAAVRVNGTSFDWYILRSSTGVLWIDKFGNSATDIIVPGDYDGDGKTDMAVWRTGAGADQGNFFVRNSVTSPVQFKWGSSAGTLTSPDYPVANWRVK